MSDQNSSVQDTIAELVSRRGFLKGAASVVAAQSTMAVAKGMGYGRDQAKTFAYVGTYTGDDGNGQGIYLYDVDSQSGALTLIKLASATNSPSALILSSTGKYLYAVNEVSDFQGSNGSVSAYAVNRSTGDLTLLNVVSSKGGGPVFLSVDATGKYLFVSNYGGGSLAVLPVKSDGSLGTAVDFHLDTGNVGPTTPTNAPPGSTADSGHDAPHVHCAVIDPNNKFVLQTDLGQDRIYSYSFNSGSGKLTPADTPFVSLPPGDGPRHIAFHPNGNWVYSIQEEASTLTFFLYDCCSGALQFQQMISSLPPGFTGTSYASELEISADGKFLYAANRLEDSITLFTIGGGGQLTYVAETATQGKYPRQFAIGPTGSFLYVCNQNSDNLTSFSIDAMSGGLTFTGQSISVGTPSCIEFLAT